MNETVERLHPLEIAVLMAFKKKDVFSNEELAIASEIPVNQLRTAIEWLLLKNFIKTSEIGRKEFVSITSIGSEIAENGFPETKILEVIASNQDGISLKDLPTAVGMEPAKVNPLIGNLRKNSAVVIENGIIKKSDSDFISTLEKRLSIFKKIKELGTVDICELSKEEVDEVRQGFKKRTPEKGFFRIDEKILLEISITEEGKSVLPFLKIRQVVNQITPQLLASGKWREAEIRKYDINLNAPKLLIGKKHPYRQFLENVRQKLVGLGFEEMSGPLVENEFWDMDALFMPQFHSARNIHDVYFVKNTEKPNDIEEPFYSNVKSAHENGKQFASRGWGYTFDEERTKRLIMRSQGTAISARTLASGPKNPGKYFAVARCFRYDQIDATHGTDFFQVEGIAVDENINFAKLLGLLKLFAKEIAGTEEIKFRPAYFPFTEPSVEMHAKHPILGWIELGGAGIFRKEVTLPLGVKSPVIAWGLGIDRMAMVSLGINDIRQLFSHDLDFIRDSKGV